MTVARVRLRRGTAAEWSAANPVLAAGEPGFETDTGVVRVGDGSTAFLSLPLAGPEGPAGADGLGVPAGGSAGQVLAKASASDNDTEWVDPPAGGGTSWTLLDDNPLTSLTGLTVRSGSWSLTGPGSVLKQTGTGSGSYSRVDVDISGGGYNYDAAAVEVEVYLHGNGNTSFKRAWVHCTWDGSSTGAPVGGIRWGSGGTWRGEVERDAVAAGTNGSVAAKAYNQWIQVRHMNWGGTSSIYIDGVLACSWAHSYAPGVGSRTHIGLYTYGCDASFRNLKGWKAETAPVAPPW